LLTSSKKFPSVLALLYVADVLFLSFFLYAYVPLLLQRTMTRT
jgi:hypothetical protein